MVCDNDNENSIYIKAKLIKNILKVKILFSSATSHINLLVRVQMA